MIEEKYGLRITSSPDTIKVGAINNEGACALSTWVKPNRDVRQLRAKLNISEKKYPNIDVKQMLNGIIYMVVFKAD